MRQRDSADLTDRIAGAILGTAVGDALGLPREGLSRRRGRRLFGAPPLRHRWLLGRGMVSDDTEHTCMTAQALLRARGDPDAFARALAWRLRLWLLGAPAGVGWATLRAILKLWLGCSPATSGVWSAGNGPTMRAAVLGVCLGDDHARLRAFVAASTRLTHRDPRAERGALLVALAAHHGALHGLDGVDTFLPAAHAAILDLDDELAGILARVDEHCQRGAPAAELADALGLERGVTGYVYHTVPLALYCWMRHPGDFRAAVEEVIDLGGDTDSTGAVVGGIVGATVGAANIPADWLDGLLEWPRSVAWMRGLAERLAGPAADARPLALFWPGLLPRNTLFLSAVVMHVLRRWLPPY